MQIDPVERLAYWQEREQVAADRVKFWLTRGDKVAPGATKRATDWHRFTVDLVRGWQKKVDDQAKRQPLAA